MARQAVQRLAGLAVCAVALSACGGGSGGGVGPNTVTANVSLSPAAYALYTGSQVTGRVHFPAATTATQYLVVGQFATGNTDVSANIAVNVGLAAVANVAVGPLARFATGPAGTPTAATQFHDMLRRREAEMARAPRAAGPLFSGPARAAQVTPPTQGSSRTFKVCSSITCSSLVNVTAIARFVGQHAAIYVDTLAPANGFTATDLANLGGEFDSTLYPIDHNAFGAESDIDTNGVVIILLTPKINALIGKPQCNTSFVTGFFYGADIAPGLAASHNNGEVFYGMVPDPSGSVSCAYSTNFVRNIIPVTFIHEFQHMISFNQHVLVRGSFSTEALWLNEGMSHLAEELGGLHFDSVAQDTTASHFFTGDFYNGYQYLANPSANTMVTDSPPGSLESRGGEWLFLRYVVDQYGAGTTTRALEQTANVGATNLAAVTGVTFPTLVGRWALAVWASDLDSVQGGFTPPPELRYRTWSYRHQYASLHSQDPSVFARTFPLLPAQGGPGTGVVVSGTLTSGSGTYVLINQAAGAAAFDLTFLTPSGAQLPSNAGAQLAVLRTQ